MDWYTLRVISGKEKKIRDSLLLEIDQGNLKEKVADVLVPSENIVEMKDGKKKIRNKVFFPGYILVKMNMEKEVRYVVENMDGVLNFVGSKERPQPLRPNEVTRILGEVEGREGKDMVSQPYSVGDSVKVVDGPFFGFQWICSRSQ